MAQVKFWGVLLLTLGLTLFLQTHHPLGTSLPALGRLMSPFQGFWQQAEPRGAMPEMALTDAALKAPVEVVFDDRRVPHVFAENETDAVFVQGYVTASFRLWQMDLATRAVAGRLAEVLGEQALENDLRQRRKGILVAAEATLAALQTSPEEKEILEAYAAGVNAFIEQLQPRDYPLEFKLLGYRPEAWTPLKTILFFKNMAETLCSRNEDVPSSNTLALLGESLFSDLFPEYNPQQSPVIPVGTPWDFQPVTVEAKDSVSSPMIGFFDGGPDLPQPPPFLGSNNWAVSGTKTASGYPILCNDPHLQLSLPSIWFEIQLHTPQSNVYGVSLPGVPGVIIGFNEFVAWGMTNVGHDVLDWYAIKWLDAAKTQYAYDGGSLPVTYQIEEIRVRGKATVVDSVKYTVWGPIVEQREGEPYQDLARHWLANDLPEKRDFYEVGAFQRLNQSRNYADYRAALLGYDAPAQNFVFASNEGDVAITVNGHFPLRRREQGRFVQDGSSSANAWAGFIPRDQVPAVKNPPRGFVASANQHSTDPSYPYYYLGGFDDYRGRIINRTLDSLKQVTIADMMALQANSQSIKAEEAVPLLLAMTPQQGLSPEERMLLDLLAKWDYRFTHQSQAPIAFQAVFDSAYQLTFDELLPLADSLPVLAPEAWRFIALLKDTPDHLLFDRQQTPVREKASDILLLGLQQAARAWVTPLREGLTWAEVNKSSVNHLLRLPAFSSGLLDTDGYADAPNAVRGTHGPSWRMIVALGPNRQAYGVFPGGQSGNPGSFFYDNMISQWVAGEYNELHLWANARESLPRSGNWRFAPAPTTK